MPTASDGTSFDPITCRRAGGYWVGPKGREHKYTSYRDALVALNLMAKPQWRRPNPKGNWGIVVATSWA
ncbi:hypothetical protein CWO91_08075 [Bradyrhizobium genosp. SA-3]|nr:hypothetical protein CWO91_08075 [Bradyrhizobium genosp. SA-3]